MRNKIIILIIALVFTGCKRRCLEDEYSYTALIPINIDWSDANLDTDYDPNDDVYSASAWFFPDSTNDSQSVIVKRLTDPDGGTVELPVGTYSVIVFNNATSDYSNIAFRGTDSFSTFDAYAVDASDASYSLRSTTVISHPEILATWSMENFVVTEEMVNSTRGTTSVRSSISVRSVDEDLEQLTSVRPQLMVDTASVTVHVQGLDNASSGTGTHTGLPSSVYLSSGTTSNTTTSHTFTLTNRTYYDGSTTDGTVEADYRTFGRHSDDSTSTHTMQINFTLNNDESHSTDEFDISDQVNSATNRLQLNTVVGLDSDQTIVLPEVNIDGEGFDIGVEDWDTEVDIPMNI